MSEALKSLGIEYEEMKVKGNSRPRYYARVDKEKISEIMKKLKNMGYNYMVALSCVDWLKDNKFELIYHLWSYEKREDIFLSVMINRDEPKFQTLRDLYPQIETHEREIHEMFGIEFEGNDRLNEFILEDWNDMPPMRKDFDTEKYAKEKYGSVPFVDKENEGGERK